MLIAKKPKMAIYTLVAVVLIAAVAVGCTFIGAQESGDREAEITIKIDVQDNVPDAVLDYAKEYVQQNIEYYEKLGANPPDGSGVYTIIDAKITGLTQINTGTAGLNNSINMYLLEYRLLSDNPDNVILAGGMTIEDGWITEWGSTGQPYLLLFCDNSGAETVWQRICVTNTDIINVDYGTPEMLEQYGNAYTAAAMELYHKYLKTNTTTNSDITDDDITPLTEEQLAQANDAFASVLSNTDGSMTVNPISCFFTSYYDSVEDLDLAEFMRYFPHGGSVTGEAEFNALKAQENWPFGADITLDTMPVPISKYMSEAIDKVLREYADVSLEELNGIGLDSGGLLYLEEYDAYYNFTSDFGPGTFSCVRGERQGNIVRLYTEYSEETGGAMLTLCEKDGRYLIVSHQRIGVM